MRIEMCATTTGLGDHCTAIYTACGLADNGHSVEFYTPYYKWFERIHHPNVTILPETKKVPFSVYWRYDDELVAAQKGTCESRPLWYAQNAAEFFNIDVAKPSLPATVNGPKSPHMFGKPYVLIAPFSAGPTRAWDKDHWQMFAEEMIKKGYVVVAVGSAKEDVELRRMFSWLPEVICVAGAEPFKVLDLIHHAHRVVGNDSSIVHLAALHRKYATVVCAHVKPEFVFGPAFKYITTVSPDEGMYPCTWCCWTHDGGLRWGCHEHCDALQSIDHTKVIQLLQVG